MIKYMVDNINNKLKKKEINTKIYNPHLNNFFFALGGKWETIKKTLLDIRKKKLNFLCN